MMKAKIFIDNNCAIKIIDEGLTTIDFEHVCMKNLEIIKGLYPNHEENRIRLEYPLEKV